MYEANLTNAIQISGEVKGWVQENKGIVNQYIISQVSSLLGSQPLHETPLTGQEYRQRKVLLGKVKEYWLAGVLEKLWQPKASVAPKLKKRSDVLKQPFSDVEALPEESRATLSTDAGATYVFNRMEEGRTLLILGEPGSGKTTTLLKLARDLVAHTEEDLRRPIPVILNLSSWTSKRQAIADWLIEELSSKYQVSKALGRVWVEEQQLLLLLDGLDEVKGEYREACVQAINQFLQDYGQSDLVICSRIRDYEALSNRLQLRGAICIQPLTSEQIDRYLDEAGAPMKALKKILREDPALQELAKSPLMLSVMALAYQGISFADLPKTGSVEKRRYHLFNTYLEKMFERKGAIQPYPEAQVKHWLTWLAQRMSQTSQSVFLIEQMQPTWLENEAQRILYRFGSLAIEGLIFGAIGILLAQELGGLIGVLSVGIATILSKKREKIETVETLHWSWQEAKKIASHKLERGASLGLILGLILGLSDRLKDGFMGGLLLGLMYGVIATLILALIGAFRGAEIETKTIPNQGIWRSLGNAAIIGTLGGVIGGLLGWLVGGLILGLTNWLWLGLIYGLTVGTSFGGGKACIQHLSLRLILYSNHDLPWNYARFLDYASDRIFLQKVGGGYIFIHRMLLEHFAQLNASHLSDRGAIKPYLGCPNCGCKNPVQFNFCSKCGMRLIKQR